MARTKAPAQPAAPAVKRSARQSRPPAAFDPAEWTSAGGARRSEARTSAPKKKVTSSKTRSRNKKGIVSEAGGTTRPKKASGRKSKSVVASSGGGHVDAPDMAGTVLAAVFSLTRDEKVGVAHRTLHDTVMQRVEGHVGASSEQFKQSMKNAKALLMTNGIVKFKHTPKGGAVLALEDTVGEELKDLKEDENDDLDDDKRAADLYLANRGISTSAAKRAPTRKRTTSTASDSTGKGTPSSSRRPSASPSKKGKIVISPYSDKGTNVEPASAGEADFETDEEGPPPSPLKSKTRAKMGKRVTVRAPQVSAQEPSPKKKRSTSARSAPRKRVKLAEDVGPAKVEPGDVEELASDVEGAEKPNKVDLAPLTKSALQKLKKADLIARLEAQTAADHDRIAELEQQLETVAETNVYYRAKTRIYKRATAQHGGEVSSDEEDAEIEAAINEAYARSATKSDAGGDVQVEEIEEGGEQEEAEARKPTPGPSTGAAVVKDKGKGKGKVVLEPYIDIPSTSRQKIPSSRSNSRPDDAGQPSITGVDTEHAAATDLHASQDASTSRSFNIDDFLRDRSASAPSPGPSSRNKRDVHGPADTNSEDLLVSNPFAAAFRIPSPDGPASSRDKRQVSAPPAGAREQRVEEGSSPFDYTSLQSEAVDLRRRLASELAKVNSLRVDLDLLQRGHHDILSDCAERILTLESTRLDLLYRYNGEAAARIALTKKLDASAPDSAMNAVDVARPEEREEAYRRALGDAYAVEDDLRDQLAKKDARIAELDRDLQASESAYEALLASDREGQEQRQQAARQVEKLGAELAAARKELIRAQEMLAAEEKTEKGKLVKEIEQLKTDLDKALLDLSTMRARSTELEADLDRSQQDADLLRQEKAASDSALRDASTKQQELIKENDELREAVSSLQERLRAIEAEEQALTQADQQAITSLNGDLAALANENEDLQGVLEDLRPLAEKYVDHADLECEAVKEMETWRTQVDSRDAKIATLEGELAAQLCVDTELQTRAEEAESEWNELLQDKAALEQEKVALEREKDALAQAKEILEQQKARLEGMLASSGAAKVALEKTLQETVGERDAIGERIFRAVDTLSLPRSAADPPYSLHANFAALDSLLDRMRESDAQILLLGAEADDLKKRLDSASAAARAILSSISSDEVADVALDTADVATLFEQIQQRIDDLETSIGGLKAEKTSLEGASRSATTRAATAEAALQQKEGDLVGQKQKLDESLDRCARLEDLVSRLNDCVQIFADEVAKEISGVDVAGAGGAAAAVPVDFGAHGAASG